MCVALRAFEVRLRELVGPLTRYTPETFDQTAIRVVVDEIEALLTRSPMVDLMWQVTGSIEYILPDLSPAEEPSIVADILQIGKMALEGPTDEDPFLPAGSAEPLNDADAARRLGDVMFSGYLTTSEPDGFPLAMVFDRLVEALLNKNESEVRGLSRIVMTEANSVHLLRTEAFRLYGRLQGSIRRRWPNIPEPTWTV